MFTIQIWLPWNLLPQTDQQRCMYICFHEILCSSKLSSRVPSPRIQLGTEKVSNIVSSHFRFVYQQQTDSCTSNETTGCCAIATMMVFPKILPQWRDTANDNGAGGVVLDDAYAYVLWSFSPHHIFWFCAVIPGLLYLWPIFYAIPIHMIHTFCCVTLFLQLWPSANVILDSETWLVTVMVT